MTYLLLFEFVLMFICRITFTTVQQFIQTGIFLIEHLFHIKANVVAQAIKKLQLKPKSLHCTRCTDLLQFDSLRHGTACS